MAKQKNQTEGANGAGNGNEKAPIVNGPGNTQGGIDNSNTQNPGTGDKEEDKPQPRPEDKRPEDKAPVKPEAAPEVKAPPTPPEPEEDENEEEEQEQEEIEVEVNIPVDVPVEQIMAGMVDIYKHINDQLLRQPHPALTVLARNLRQSFISARGLGVNVEIPDTIVTGRSQEQRQHPTASKLGQVTTKADDLTAEQRVEREKGIGKKKAAVKTNVSNQPENRGALGSVVSKASIGQAPPEKKAEPANKANLTGEERTRAMLENISKLSEEDFRKEYVKPAALKSLARAINEQEGSEVVPLSGDVADLQTNIHGFLTKGAGKK